MATAAERRNQLREKLWPGTGDRVWDRHSNKGFTTIPRLLPLIMTLVKMLAKKVDPSAAYFELWTRAFDDGLVSINDENLAAYGSGYTGTRAVRTWKERIDTLEKLGFIAVKSAANKRVAHVLLHNPLLVIAEMKTREPEKIPEDWWIAYVSRANEIGAELPVAAEAKGSMAPQSESDAILSTEGHE